MTDLFDVHFTGTPFEIVYGDRYHVYVGNEDSAPITPESGEWNSLMMDLGSMCSESDPDVLRSHGTNMTGQLLNAGIVGGTIEPVLSPLRLMYLILILTPTLTLILTLFHFSFSKSLGNFFSKRERKNLPVQQLDPTVWTSSGSVLFDGQPLGSYDISKIELEHRLLCEFRDIFVDPGHIYLVPRPDRYREAIRDLSKCCMPLADDKSLAEAECNGPVKLDLFFCFHRFKYVPAVWSHAKERVREPSLRLKGTTWLMHHWTTVSHPAIFRF